MSVLYMLYTLNVDARALVSYGLVCMFFFFFSHFEFAFNEMYLLLCCTNVEMFGVYMGVYTNGIMV